MLNSNVDPETRDIAGDSQQEASSALPSRPASNRASSSGLICTPFLAILQSFPLRR
jgi:hypothetical protein